MKKLEIELYRYRNLVFGKVLYQDESLRDKRTIVEKDAFRIQSCIYPELLEKMLLINGIDKTKDNNIFYHQFCDEETAIKTCGKIKECVDSINKTEKNQLFVEKII